MLDTCSASWASSAGARTNGARSATSTRSNPPGGKSSNTAGRKRSRSLPARAWAASTAARSSSQATTSRAPRETRNSADAPPVAATAPTSSTLRRTKRLSAKM